MGTSGGLTPGEQKGSSSASSTRGYGSGSGGIAGLYDLEETLGKGHFSIVRRARHVLTKEAVAVKVVDKVKVDEKQILKEVLCMKLVQHPNVVRLYEVIDTTSKLFLVLELAKGDLFDLIHLAKKQNPPYGLSESSARHYFVQIFDAVAYCHRLHVVHRDLKPENVVYFMDKSKPKRHVHASSKFSPANTVQLSQGQSNQSVLDNLATVKLTDFGFSNNFCPGKKLDTSCGSLEYSAPEILLGDAYDPPAVDIWSLGVILYTLVVGIPPFQEANDSETLTRIMDVKYTPPPRVSRSCRDLIQKMLQRTPEQRIRDSELARHEWVKGHVRGDEEVLIDKFQLTDGEREKITSMMVEAGLVKDANDLQKQLNMESYNNVTSTYYLLSEKLLRERRNQKPPVHPLKATPSSSKTMESEVGGGGGDGGRFSPSPSSPMAIPKRSSPSPQPLPLSSSCISDLGSSSVPGTSSASAGIAAAAAATEARNSAARDSSSSSSSSSSSDKKSYLSRKAEKCKKQQPVLEKVPEKPPQASVANASKKKGFFGWLFKRHSLSVERNNNTSRIYKTRSCSELKIQSVN